MAEVVPIMKNRSNGAPGEPWNVSTSEVAEYLGLNVETVYRMEPEEIPYTVIRGRRRYRWSDVERYVEENRP